MTGFSRWLQKAKKSHLAIGVPIICTVLLGTYGMSFLMQTKIDFQSQRQHMVSLIEPIVLD